MKMRLFVCTDHDGCQTAPRTSGVMAPDEEKARIVLDRLLVKQGLLPFASFPYTLKEEVDTSQPRAAILDSSDY